MIRGNERRFDALSGCEPMVVDGDNDGGSGNLLTFRGVNLSAEFLDVNATRENVSSVMHSVSQSIDEYRSWLDDKERDFELAFWLNKVPSSGTLLNNVSRVVSRVKKDRVALNKWYAELQDEANDALDAVSEYERLRDQLQLVGGADIAADTPIAAARRNLSSVRSTQRVMTRLIRAESKLRDRIANIRMRVDAFARGVIRVNGERSPLDMIATARAIDELTSGGSALERVQDIVARRLAADGATRLTLTQARPIERVDLANGFTSRSKDGDHVSPSDDEILRRTRDIADKILLTENTRPMIEQFVNALHSRIKPDHPMRGELDALLNRLYNNYPNRVIEELLGQARREDGIYLRIQRANNILLNLDPGDRIYEAPLREVIREMNDFASRLINESL